MKNKLSKKDLMKIQGGISSKDLFNTCNDAKVLGIACLFASACKNGCKPGCDAGCIGTERSPTT